MSTTMDREDWLRYLIANNPGEWMFEGLPRRVVVAWLAGYTMSHYIPEYWERQKKIQGRPDFDDCHQALCHHIDGTLKSFRDRAPLGKRRGRIVDVNQFGGQWIENHDAAMVAKIIGGLL